MFAGQDPRDVERLFMLSELNAAYAALGVLAFVRGIHPLLAYTELCRIVGQLSIFGKTRRPPEIPRYDHDDLARIFYYIKQQIDLLLDAIPEYEFEQRPFIGEGLGMQVRLESRWFGVDWDWYVGVSRGSLSEAELRTLLGELAWKLGSSRQVDLLFSRRQEGLDLTPLEQAPAALPSNRDWTYFVVNRQNAAWKDVFATQTLAMRLQEHLILNRDKLQGERVLIVSARGKIGRTAVLAVCRATPIMTPKFSEAVDPVFLHVLRLLERIERGETALRQGRATANSRPDHASRGALGAGPDWQLAKYALVAWIDEVLIEAAWDGGSWWKENALEQEIFSGMKAYHQFYMRAKDATSLPRRDALEVFYVCVVLGFRGLYRDPVEAVAEAEGAGYAGRSGNLGSANFHRDQARAGASADRGKRHGAKRRPGPGEQGLLHFLLADRRHPGRAQPDRLSGFCAPQVRRHKPRRPSGLR